jgi:tetratricopeptide (TPR) repeat protein
MLAIALSSLSLDSYIASRFGNIFFVSAGDFAMLAKRELVDKSPFETYPIAFVAEDGQCLWTLQSGNFFRLYAIKARQIKCISTSDWPYSESMAGARVFSVVKQPEGWSLIRSPQDKLMEGLKLAAAQITSDTHNVLLTGLNFPFDPLFYEQPLKEIPESIALDILSYSGGEKNQLGIPQPGKIRRVSVDAVHLESYDQLWLFRSDGSLLKIVQHPLHSDNSVLYPELYSIFQGTFHDFILQGTDGYKFLQCGTISFTYEYWDGAEQCLKKAVEFIGENSYSHYFLGIAQEKKGDLLGAKKSFENAVAKDNAAKTNPAFSEGLKRVESAALSAKN